MATECTATLATYRFVFDGDGKVCFSEDGKPLSPDLRYFVDDALLARAVGKPLLPELADLVDLAIAVYVVDRLARRVPSHADRYHLHWTRELFVRLPVRDPGRWIDTVLGKYLEKALLFLTEDYWHFEFVPRCNHPRLSERQTPLIYSAPSDPVIVSLFSGGLDSFAGTCHDLGNLNGGTMYLFSGRTNQRIGARQGLLSHTLQIRPGNDIRPLVVKFGLYKRNGRTDYDESTQRSRGFVYPILASVSAVLTGAHEVRVYEPGIGAINLPYTGAQLGSQATRASDPRMLLKLSQLVEMATGVPVNIHAPFLFFTKAELCRSIDAIGLGHLAKETISCDNVSLRVKGHTHCGLCTSCLLRRQGLDSAGLGDADRKSGIYRDDLFAAPNAIRSEKLYGLRVMDHQWKELAWAIQSDNPWRQLSAKFPQLIEIAAIIPRTAQESVAIEEQLVDLYRRYVIEWISFRAGLLGVLTV